MRFDHAEGRVHIIAIGRAGLCASMKKFGRVPEHLIVLGGGYVGLELAQAMWRFGSAVTVIERGPQLVNERLETTAPGVGAMGDCAGSAVHARSIR